MGPSPTPAIERSFALDQAIAWLGESPVIILDEAHRAKNAVEQKNAR